MPIDWGETRGFPRCRISDDTQKHVVCGWFPVVPPLVSWMPKKVCAFYWLATRGGVRFFKGTMSARLFLSGALEEAAPAKAFGLHRRVVIWEIITKYTT